MITLLILSTIYCVIGWIKHEQGVKLGKYPKSNPMLYDASMFTVTLIICTIISSIGIIILICKYLP